MVADPILAVFESLDPKLVTEGDCTVLNACLCGGHSLVVIHYGGSLKAFTVSPNGTIKRVGGHKRDLRVQATTDDLRDVYNQMVWWIDNILHALPEKITVYTLMTGNLVVAQFDAEECRAIYVPFRLNRPTEPDWHMLPE